MTFINKIKNLEDKNKQTKKTAEYQPYKICNFKELSKLSLDI